MSLKPNLLLIDDDQHFHPLFQMMTEEDFNTDCKHDSVSLFQNLEVCRKYDALIVDLHMPGVDGLNFCYKAKQLFGKEFPVFLLSQDSAENSKILGLKLKVDDYLLKTMSWDELKLRIRNRIQRDQFEYEGLVAFEHKLQIEIKGQTIPITKLELSILKTVIENLSPLLTRRQLMQLVWQGRAVVAHTLNTHLHNLNNKIKPWGRQIRIDRDGLVSLSSYSDLKNDNLNKEPSSTGV